MNTCFKHLLSVCLLIASSVSLQAQQPIIHLSPSDNLSTALLKAQNIPTSSITIVLGEGIYHLEQPIILSADSWKNKT